MYHGVNVGQITEVRLDPDQRHVHIFADVLTKPPLPANDQSKAQAVISLIGAPREEQFPVMLP